MRAMHDQLLRVWVVNCEGWGISLGTWGGGTELMRAHMVSNSALPLKLHARPNPTLDAELDPHVSLIQGAQPPNSTFEPTLDPTFAFWKWMQDLALYNECGWTIDSTLK